MAGKRNVLIGGDHTIHTVDGEVVRVVPQHPPWPTDADLARQVLELREADRIKPAMDDADSRPNGSNADEWALFLDGHRGADGFCAVQIAEAIEEAEQRGMARAAGIARGQIIAEGSEDRWYRGHTCACKGIARTIETDAKAKG